MFLCNKYITRAYSSCLNKSYILWPTCPFSPATIAASVNQHSGCLTFWDSIDKWDNEIFVSGLFHLVCCPHPGCCKCQNFYHFFIEQHSIVYMPYFKNLFIYSWTHMSWLLWYYLDKHGSAAICSMFWFQFLWKYIQMWDSWIIW